MSYPWHLYLMGGLYILAGIMHFVSPGYYLKVIPDFLPNPQLLVFASGIAEILLGIGCCFPKTKNLALYGIMAMLTVFLVIHFNMIFGEEAGMGFPKFVLWGRLVLQFALIWWAWSYLKYP